MALVAQRIEQKTSNLLAAGSIPAEGALSPPFLGLRGLSEFSLMLRNYA